MTRMHGLVVHPRLLSPAWLDGSITVYELTAYTARKLARANGVHLPHHGHYMPLPTASGWRELHRNSSREKPFYVF
jgi:hypothetical protein